MLRSTAPDRERDIARWLWRALTRVLEDERNPRLRRLAHAKAEAFASGSLRLAVALVAGAADCSGPVRQYLAIDPVLRSILAAHAAGPT